MKREEFFKLPISCVLEDGPLIMPIESRYDSPGYRDVDGKIWVKVVGENDKLMRQEISI